MMNLFWNLHSGSLLDDFFPTVSWSYDAESESYVADLVLAGVDKTKLSVKAHKSVVVFAGEDRNKSKFSYKLSLPKNADSESLTASLENGILSLRIKPLGSAASSGRVVEIT